METCLEALYGIYLLRMQQKPVSPATLEAAKCITTFLGLLSDYYLKERRGELDRYHLDEEKPHAEGERPHAGAEKPHGQAEKPHTGGERPNDEE